MALTRGMSWQAPRLLASLRRPEKCSGQSVSKSSTSPDQLNDKFNIHLRLTACPRPMFGLPAGLARWSISRDSHDFPIFGHHGSRRANSFASFRCRCSRVRRRTFDGNGICPHRSSYPGNCGILAVIVGRVAPSDAASVPRYPVEAILRASALRFDRPRFVPWCWRVNVLGLRYV